MSRRNLLSSQYSSDAALHGIQHNFGIQPPNVQQLISVTYDMNTAQKKIIDLPEFNGAAEDWPMFLTTFNQSTAVYQYNNFENCLRL